MQKAIIWTYKPLVCKNCGTKHVVTNKTRNFYGILFPILGGAVAFGNISMFVGILSLLTIGIIVVLLFPYVATYRVKNND